MNEMSHRIDVLLSQDDYVPLHKRNHNDAHDDGMRRAIEATKQRIDEAFSKQKKVKATVRIHVPEP